MDDGSAETASDSLEETRFDKLQREIDFRCASLAAIAWDENSKLAHLDDELFAAYWSIVRAAYGFGYNDALEEDKRGRRGWLHESTGY